MLDNSWPPPPQIPASARPHEAFLTDRLLATPAKQSLSPITLCLALRQETGMDWRTCRATVRDYCDRHGIFPQPRGPRAWLPALPMLCIAASVTGMIVSQVLFEHLINSLPFGPAQTRLIQEQLRWGGLMAQIVIIMSVLSLCGSLLVGRKERRDAAAARQAVAAWARAEAGGAGASV